MNWWYGLWYRCGSIRISFAQVARAGKNPVFFLPTVYILVKNLYFFAHTLFTSSNFCPVLYFGKIRELYFCLYSVNFLNYCIKLQTIFIIWLWSFFSRRGGLLTWIYPVVLYYIYTVYSQLTSGLQSIHVPFTDEFVSIQNSTNQKKPGVLKLLILNKDFIGWELESIILEGFTWIFLHTHVWMFSGFIKNATLIPAHYCWVSNLD